MCSMKNCYNSDIFSYDKKRPKQSSYIQDYEIPLTNAFSVISMVTMLHYSHAVLHDIKFHWFSVGKHIVSFFQTGG